ncbi:AlpA family transcriptional regulator [Herbaspirillum sp. ST 5-3]|uniref:helix-turn-helix transcriptional regulator n=1 Tax=Oxalobacteraceae TaxID=75682 RepID=UPI0010A499F3|nr:AlpA family transcriptional regulator [Herbaspirillum sp. ST 5-3]
MTTNIEFLKLAVVMGKTGKSRSSIYQAIKDGEFPAPVRIGPRAVAWTSTSIAEWQQSRIQASKAA